MNSYLPSSTSSTPSTQSIHPVVVSPEEVPDCRGAVAVLSQVNRDGDWILPRLFKTFTFMGNVELDLTRARIGPGVSRMEITSILGNVTVVVPHHLRVECDGDPFIGSFEMEREARTIPNPDAPLVQIAGTAFLASVTIKVVDPNAPGWFEKLRARWSSQ